MKLKGGRWVFMKITRADLIAYLSDEYQPRCEPNYDGSMVYYVHIADDGSLVDSIDLAEITVTSTLDISLLAEGSTMGDVYAKETESDPDFSNMVDDLMAKVQNALDDIFGDNL